MVATTTLDVDNPLAVASIIVASIVLAATYALGCRTFRLRLSTLNLLALAAFTLLFGIAVVQLVRAGVLAPDYDPPSGRVAKFADQALAVMCVIIFLPALVLLIVQGVLAWRLWRHRLGEEPEPGRSWRSASPANDCRRSALIISMSAMRTGKMS